MKHEQYDEEKLSHQEPVCPISEWQGYNDLADYDRSVAGMEDDPASFDAVPERAVNTGKDWQQL